MTPLALIITLAFSDAVAAPDVPAASTDAPKPHHDDASTTRPTAGAPPALMRYARFSLDQAEPYTALGGEQPVNSGALVLVRLPQDARPDLQGRSRGAWLGPYPLALLASEPGGCAVGWSPATPDAPAALFAGPVALTERLTADDAAKLGADALATHGSLWHTTPSAPLAAPGLLELGVTAADWLLDCAPNARDHVRGLMPFAR